MAHPTSRELRRRSLAKSLLWRLIGVVWTWAGAYIILQLVPPSRRSAALIATLIVVYHHSTRMLMYYAYERLWASVAWGRDVAPSPMSRREKLLWASGTVVALALIFFLLLEVSPKLKARPPPTERRPRLQEVAPTQRPSGSRPGIDTAQPTALSLLPVAPKRRGRLPHFFGHGAKQCRTP